MATRSLSATNGCQFRSTADAVAMADSMHARRRVEASTPRIAAKLSHCFTRSSARGGGGRRHSGAVHQGADPGDAGVAARAAVGGCRCARRPVAVRGDAGAAPVARVADRGAEHGAARHDVPLEGVPPRQLALRDRRTRPVPGLLRRPAGRVRGAVGSDGRRRRSPAERCRAPTCWATRRSRRYTRFVTRRTSAASATSRSWSRRSTSASTTRVGASLPSSRSPPVRPTRCGRSSTRLVPRDSARVRRPSKTSRPGRSGRAPPA